MCIWSLSRCFSRRGLQQIPIKPWYLDVYIRTWMILNSFVSLSSHLWENTLTYKNVSSAAVGTSHENCLTYEEESWPDTITIFFSPPILKTSQFSLKSTLKICAVWSRIIPYGGTDGHSTGKLTVNFRNYFRNASNSRRKMALLSPTYLRNTFHCYVPVTFWWNECLNLAVKMGNLKYALCTVQN